MKFILTITCCLLSIVGITQTSSNFTINKVLYEFKISKADDTHLQFSIAKALLAGGAQDFKNSILILNTIAASDFNTQFDALMVQVDSGYDPTAAPLKTQIDNVKITLYSTLQSSQKTSEQQRLDELDTKMTKLFGMGPDIRPIGYFTMLNKPIATKKLNANGDTEDSSAADKTVKEISVILSNGSIAKRGLKIIFADGREFTNRDAPVNLYNFYKETVARLYENDARSVAFVLLGDVIRYSTLGRFYYPGDNDDIHLNSSHTVDTIKVATDINHLLDVSVYSDFLGLLGHKANGILQTEVNSTIISNTATWGNSDIVVNNFVKGYARFSKFDSRFGQLDSSKVMFGKGGEKDTVNRTYLNQVSYLQAGLKINFIRFGIGNNQMVFINGGVDFNLASADSLYKKDIGFINWYPEIEYSITWLKNWEFNTSGRILYQNLTGDAPFGNKNVIKIINFQAAVSYYPFADPESRMYLRFSYYNNLDEGSYNFPQFQFGFKTSLFGQKKTIAK